MAKNNLSSTIIEQCDCNIISFLDTSEYLPDITNPILRITPPNFTNYKNIEYNLNAITVIKPEHLYKNCLEGGVYHFVQSVCPNDKVQLEFCYLHICNELDQLNNVVCNNFEDEEILEKVFDLKMKLEVAQRLVKNCDVRKGTEMYNIVVENIKKLDCKDCPNV